MREEVIDGGRQNMVGVHQPIRPSHDAVPVRIRVVGEGDVEFAVHSKQPGSWHSVRNSPSGCGRPSRRS